MRTVRRSRSRSFRVSAVISLSPAERREGLEKQERLPPLGHQIDKGIDLIEGQHRPFSGPFLAGALDATGVDDDQLILSDPSRRMDLGSISEGCCTIADVVR